MEKPSGWLRDLTTGDGEALGDVQLPEGVEGAESYGIHPALLDAAFQASSGLLAERALSLPFAIERLTVHEPGVRGGIVYVQQKGDTLDVTLADTHGRILVDVEGLRTRAATSEVLDGKQQRRKGSLCCRLACEKERLPATASYPWVVGLVVGNSPGASALQRRIEDTGAHAHAPQT